MWLPHRDRRRRQDGRHHRRRADGERHRHVLPARRLRRPPARDDAVMMPPPPLAQLVRDRRQEVAGPRTANGITEPFEALGRFGLEPKRPSIRTAIRKGSAVLHTASGAKHGGPLRPKYRLATPLARQHI